MKSALRIQASDSPTKELFNKRDIFINNHQPAFPIKANRLFEKTNLNITFPTLLEFPPWTMSKIKICTHLYYLSKTYAYIPEHHKQYAIDHIKNKGPHYAIYTDGSKSSSGVGYAAISTNKTFQYSLPKDASVFTAELCAIKSAIHIIKTIPPRKFVIFTDSRSDIEAIRNYK